MGYLREGVWHASHQPSRKDQMVVFQASDSPLRRIRLADKNVFGHKRLILKVLKHFIFLVDLVWL
jgi:hypothetical protein